MFDWNDEEITNIIWGKARESDDHIVPYPDGNEEKHSGLYGDSTRKEWNEEAPNRPVEQKKPANETDLFGPTIEGSSRYEKNGSPKKGLGMESWPATSISTATRTEQDHMGTGAPNNFNEISEHSSSKKGETAQQDNSSEIFQNQQDGEHGDFVDYGWDNIGSFDDLDRIFSNDDTMFGQASLSNADELWSSSKDVTSSPVKSIPLSFDPPSLAVGALSNLSDQLEIKSECSLEQDPFASGYGKMQNPTSNTPQNFQTCSNIVGCSGGKDKPLQRKKTGMEASKLASALNSQVNDGTLPMPKEFKDKETHQKQLLGSRIKSEEKCEIRQLQDICGTWSTSGNQLPQFDNPYAPTMGQPYPPYLISQQRQLLETQSQYKHFSVPFPGSPMYANMASQYPPTVVLPQHSSGEGSHQKVISSYEASPIISDSLRKPTVPPAQPLPMTPQEKIEKLRRRQQMRAMLAIQKQQQQFNNQASSTEAPTLEGVNSEVEDALPSSKQLEKGDSSNCIQHDDCSVEDSILYSLQDIIGKLDMRIRLCIRDSLFRLAESATQRQYASYTSSTNRSGKEEVFDKGQNRFADVETETNPIDRTVAHLLFHRPLESSGKHAERPESPLSANLPCEIKSADLLNLPITQLTQSSGNEMMGSHDGPKDAFLLSEVDQTRASPGLAVSENASNIESADAIFRVDASQ